ncbi:hypothetical protein OK074_8959 [Actinobacteria bacterium OK074]|nr:hypothetical protein OK074_8959 [Actinobacteria bacterium OK074]
MKARTTTAPRPRPRRRRLLGTALAATAAATLAWLAATAGTAPSTASPSARAGHAVAPVADEAPGYAVEDFDYPGAAKILADQGITLKRGDGHIVLADCDSQDGLLQVWARSKDKICFRATGTSGYLTLEIPAVYGVEGGDQAAQVDMTVDDQQQTYDVAANTWTPVGETADEQGRSWMLVEIRTGASS